MADGPRPRRATAAARSTPSLEDVARRAGVSLATASRVTSGSSYAVSPSMRARVEQAAMELGYAPNRLARALAMKKAPTIGLVVGAITDLYFAEIARGVEAFARRAGYLTIVCNADRSPSVEAAYVRLLREHQAAGVLLAGGSFAERPDEGDLMQEIRRAEREGTAIVTLAERGLDGVPLISADAEGMLSDLTAFVVSQGHRRLTYVGGPKGFTTSELRLSGFMRALAAGGITPANVYETGFDYEAGRRVAARMLQDELPEAVVAFNDESAIGVISMLRDAGLRVPEDVSVAGVDDTRLAAIADLTTVAAPMYELGAAAAQRIIAGKLPANLHELLPHRIVERGSTRPRAVPGNPRSSLEVDEAGLATY